MHIQYMPDTPRTTFESVDPLHTQWDYLEKLGRPTTDDCSPTPSKGQSTAAVTTTPTESIPMDPRKREYILYSRCLVRRHINFTYSHLNKKLPGAEKFSGPQLVSALVRAGKDLDMLAKARKLKSRSTVSLWYAVQYALCGEFITIEQAKIRGCGPDAISATLSLAPPSSNSYPSPPPSVEDKEKKKVKAKKIKQEDALSGGAADLTGVGLEYNPNSFSAKFLRLGFAETTIKEYFEILCEQQNKGNAATFTTTALPPTPRGTAILPTAPDSTAVTLLPPTSCRKPDTGTLPRALHTPENEFILPIPPLPLPDFVPTGRPLSSKRNRSPKKEFAGPEDNRTSKHDLYSPLLRTRRMLSLERKFGKTLATAQASRRLPPKPMLEFKSQAELDSSGVSGVLRPPRVYHGRPSDWGKRYLEEQRNDLTATLETRAVILGGRVRRVPLPGSASPPRSRYLDPEPPKVSAGGAKSSGLRQITFPGQPSSTPSNGREAGQELLPKSPMRVVESVIACLKNPLAIFSKYCQVPFSGQLPTPTPTPDTQRIERNTLAQLPQETPKATPIQTQTPPPGSKRKLSSMADVEDRENQGSPVPQKRLKGRFDSSTCGKVHQLQPASNSESPSQEKESRRIEQQKRLERLFRAIEKATPTVTQTSRSSSVIKLSPVTNVRDLTDPESPLLQKRLRVQQENSTPGGVEKLPRKPDLETPSGEGMSRKIEQPKGVEGLFCAIEKATPTVAQTSRSSSMVKLSLDTNVRDLRDPESPLPQKGRRVKQEKPTHGKIDRPQQKRNSESLGGGAPPLGGVGVASRAGPGGGDERTLLASDTHPKGHQILTRVPIKRKRPNGEDVNKYGEDFFRSAKRVRTTEPSGALSPFPQLGARSLDREQRGYI
ncbi:hypothetical protein C7212DRAFT_341220 [Tuber magnatum]|uniref:Uncharacterized protein n=1 Tax=Tuber magnatum TaxID=42249 RepID=A0A317T197_9PEZI|nr:hypothetical protein C7212DRAFT_341220 [Tuber magnatum]